MEMCRLFLYLFYHITNIQNQLYNINPVLDKKNEKQFGSGLILFNIFVKLKA